MFTLKNLMEEQFEEVSCILTREHGKTIDEARGEIRRAIECVEHSAGIPTLMMGYGLESIAPGLDETRLLIDNAPMPYRAVFMVMLQAGFGCAEFEIFNESAWREIVKDPRNPKELKPGPPVKVLIFRSKTSRKELQKYYTFLADDAKELIDQWLKIRPESDLPHLFIIRQKGRRKTGTYAPVTTPLIENTVTTLAKRLKLLTPEELEIGRHHISPHKLRKVFEGLCLTHGVAEWTVEFFLGHKISRYNQVPWTQPDFVKREYDKAEPALNILTASPAFQSLSYGRSLYCCLWLQ